MRAVDTSIFELFKIGPGPSSSHTIAPMKAGYHFLQACAGLSDETRKKARSIEVRLFGSLSATGKGHGTDRAVAAGLLGQQPETCTTEFLLDLQAEPGRPRQVTMCGHSIDFSVSDVIFDALESDYPFQNTLLLSLQGEDETLFEREYYSVGGGFIQWKDQPEEPRGEPVHKYCSMEQLKSILHEKDMRLHEAMLENEQAVSGLSKKEIYSRLDDLMAIMEQAVKRGLETKGELPGSLGLHRKAPILWERAQNISAGSDRFLVSLNAYAFAAAEENAAGHIVVTAPTSGSAGVIPAVLYAMKNHLRVPHEAARDGMLAAAAIGFLAKHNASIAGAEVGCQGEVGVASAMAAGLLAYSLGWRFWVTENAAETALEHHLGLTCDPVGGFVQIPCIERNAMGAVKAYNAFLITTVEDPSHHKVDLDEVIQAMAETGRDMSRKYKETSQGGLAVSVPEC